MWVSHAVPHYRTWWKCHHFSVPLSELGVVELFTIFCFSVLSWHTVNVLHIVTNFCPWLPNECSQRPCKRFLTQKVNYLYWLCYLKHHKKHFYMCLCSNIKEFSATFIQILYNCTNILLVKSHQDPFQQSVQSIGFPIKIAVCFVLSPPAQPPTFAYLRMIRDWTSICRYLNHVTSNHKRKKG